jgi:hypothetical protein
MKGVRIHVLGDTIVDTYTYCSMAGGMTKTPTMSVRMEEKVDFVGGAGIVAKHLRAAGAEVTFSTVLGKDDFQAFVLKDLKEAGVNCLPIIDETRPTTNKNAIVVQNYRLLKLDTLDNRSISDKIVEKFQSQLGSTKVDAVAFCDFRHGIFNRSTIPALTQAIPEGAFKVADSQVASRWGNILEFQGFDLGTPKEQFEDLLDRTLTPGVRQIRQQPSTINVLPSSSTPITPGTPFTYNAPNPSQNITAGQQQQSLGSQYNLLSSADKAKLLFGGI